MQEDSARSIIRLIAITTVLAGCALTTQGLLSLLGANQALDGAQAPGMQVQLTGMVSNVGMFVIAGHASIVVWGLLLFGASRKLASMVVD